VEIWRGGPDGGALTAYTVPRWHSQTVLDVVTYVQRRLEPQLSYRFSCRVGVCGSCAMWVNGAPRWTCRTHVSKVAQDGRLRVEPLRNLHRLLGREVELARGFLLQRRRCERSRWVAPDCSLFDALHREVCAFDGCGNGRSGCFILDVEALQCLAIDGDQARTNIIA